ncbi:amino acid adenylation domain-containing protein [Rhodococcus sp. NPDC057529]|uniref:amino acid adenylation domain-containing protein n=1 Tax=Rhodococcus sp. NPDC057529 TaxID=3346158 RepID=UPI003671209C
MTATDNPAPAEIEDVLALSPLQEGLFTLAHTITDGVDPYTIQFVADIDGPVDVPLLRRSIDAVLGRHPNLRVSFWERDLPHPVQIVPARVTVPWREVDAAAGELAALADAERRRPFDLADGPALRFVLARRAPASFRLICTAHHIVMDGWSVPIFVQELVGAYLTGGSLDHLPAPRLYRDYIAWLAAQDKAAALTAWRDHLAGIDGPTMLAEGRSRRTSAGVDTLPGKAELTLDSRDTDALLQWTRAHGLTVNTATQFAWALLLGRLTDRTGVVFGATTAGRPDSIAGVETMIGLFINTLPVHVRLDDAATVREQCTALQQESARLRTHGYVGLSEVQRLAGTGDLFDSLMVFQNAPRGSVADPVTAPDGVTFTPVEMDSLTHYPLTLVPYLDGGTLGLVVEHRPDLLPHLGAREVGERLLHVLRQLPRAGDARPGVVDILVPGERERILAAAVTPEIPCGELPPAATVHGLLEHHAANTPDAAAITTAEITLTYREVDAAANRLARELLGHGIRPEQAVAVVLPRSPEFLISLFAVAKAGGTAVPLAVDSPAARRDSILAQTGARMMLTTPEFAIAGLRAVDVHAVLAGPPAPRPAVDVDPAQSLYVIFTSGSTGEPKGVVATHRGIVRLLADHRLRVYRPAARRQGRPLTVGHAWSLTFDASWQPLLALLDGHAVALFDHDTMRDPDLLVRGILARSVDVLETSPAMFTQLASAGLLFEDGGETRCRLSVLGLGGEAVGEATWARCRTLPGTAVFNFYGPTETTVDALVAGFADTPAPSVGRPMAGMGAYVLDSALRLVPDGVAGELYLSGDQVTRGYLGRPGSTSERFVAHPFARGERLYRTGDLVRRTPAGTFDYLGRGDDQVQIRGHRVELAGIESALQALPGVTSVAVLTAERPTGPGLTAFVVSSGDLDPSVLRTALADTLPAYMIPSRFTGVTALPRTPNGKLDARALLAVESRHNGEGHTAAETPTEALLLGLLSELVGTERIGATTDFFDLGVDSIAAISFVNKVRAHGVAITPRLVATHPTVRDLAAAADRAAATPTARGPADVGEVPPLPVVSWLFAFDGFRRFTQTQLIRLPTDVTEDRLAGALQAVVDAHDMLRATLTRTGRGYRVVTRDTGTVPVAAMLQSVEVTGALGDHLGTEARAAIDRIDPEHGVPLQAVLFRQQRDDDVGRARQSRAPVLLLTVHHLSVDAVSWAVLLADLAAAWQGAAVAAEVTSYRRFGELMTERAASSDVPAQRDFWVRQCAGPDPSLGSRRLDPAVDRASSLAETTTITSPQVTASLLARTSGGAGVREILLAALAATVAQWRRQRGDDPAAGTLVALEGHGRADHLMSDAGTDTTRTVGWFTTVFPVRLGAGAAWAHTLDPDAPDSALLDRVLADIAADVGAVPNAGTDFGLLRWAAEDPQLAVDPQIEFNYLGRFDFGPETSGDWSPITDRDLHTHLPLAPEPDLPLRYELEVIAAVGSNSRGPEIVTSWRWSRDVFTQEEIDRITQLWAGVLAAFAEQSRHPDT